MVTPDEYEALGLVTERLEFHESDPVSAPQFQTMIVLFGAATAAANREQKRALFNVREMIKRKESLPQIGQAILDAMGPQWAPNEEVMAQIEAINQEDE